MDTAFQDRYNKLNTKQRQAVDTIDGPVMVVAGPGSGKTELLSLRIANILRITDTAPSSILCLTFTDSGAANMKERLYQIIGDRVYKVQIYTFHAFAKRVMDEYREYFYNTFTFEPATDVAKNEILDYAFSLLSHDNKLASFRPGIGYSFFYDVKARIGLIKKAGYKADEYINLVAYAKTELIIVNKIICDGWTTDRLNLKNLIWLENIINTLENNTKNNLTAKVYVNELKFAIEKSKEENNTEAIGKWKIKNIVKMDGAIALKELYNQEKIETVAQIYKHYEESLADRSLYDFDDMIIDLRVAINSHETLKDNLAEQYQYILIDEFQDTSDAQMAIVEAITSHEVNNDRPNICVVGDDDQAIYKFQGAEINNIINFRSTQYKDVKVITLLENYRSTQNIIDFSRSITDHISYRLENVYEDIQKKLTQGNTSLSEGHIQLTHYNKKEIQYQYIAKEILKETITNTQISIAVIARKHNSIKEFSKFLNKENIKYNYIHKSNVLNLAPIKDILNVMKYLSSIHLSSHNFDYLLPEIINAPYWFISRSDIFNLSYKIKKENLDWFTGIANSDSEKLKNVYNVLLQADKCSTELPIIQFIHEYIEMSGLKAYYFGNTTHDYYIYLEGIRAFYEALSEYDINYDMYVKDINNFLNIYEKYKIPIIINSDICDKETQVTLLTAHKSKGLEYDSVYIIDVDDSEWSGANKSNNAPVPKYLKSQLTGAINTEDDNLRLLYVAISRAKQNLNISYTEDKSRYLNIIQTQKISDISDGSIALETSLTQATYNRDEKEILNKLLIDYKMSVTHLNNYLNIEEGGPAYFLAINLLRFPTPMNASSAYGSAIHDAIETIPSSLKNKGVSKDIISLEKVISKFEYVLKTKRLSPIEEKKQIDRGHKVLTRYYKEKINTFKDEDEIEVSMSGEGIVVGNAHITGNLDYIYFTNSDKENNNKNIINIIDFKTGKTLKSWDKGLDAIEKIKAHRYKYQLMMYKMMIENSNKYKDYKIGDLGLQFVEDENIFTLYYEHNDKEYERFKLLLSAVYRSILNLEFAQTSEYMSDDYYDDVTLDQIINYEDMLIAKYETKD